jgi:hypothetical protein
VILFLDRIAHGILPCAGCAISVATSVTTVLG